jgi:RNA polymerase sigma-70 factor, ECF subfamily
MVAVAAALVASSAAESEEQTVSELDDIDALVVRYRARLLRFVTYSVGEQDLAESIVQDTFVKAYRARASFRGDCSMMSWLTRIALNMVRDHQRTQKFQFWRRAGKQSVDVSEVAGVLPERASSPEAQLLARERAGEVSAVLATLSPNQKMAFLLRFAEEMSVEEMAATMGMPVSTAKTHLHRALAAVRAHLGGSR